VSTSPTENTGPLPPKVLKTTMEVFTLLRHLQQSRDPLVIRFPERAQEFQSFLVDVNRDSGRLALDELIPNDGERFIKNGEPFSVEGFHEGVRVTWSCKSKVQVGESQGARSYLTALPTEVTYHQRRNAFRVAPKQGQLLGIELADKKLTKAVQGKLADISATGCKLRFQGDLSGRLQPGYIYEHLTLQLPTGSLTTAAEVRYVIYQDKLDISFVGTRFTSLDGLAQRNIELFVFQLQRDARQLE
jgi:c-di-GMP-binding flagellar brake protein YcgR